MVSGKLPPENYPPPSQKIAPYENTPPCVNFLFFPAPNFPKNKHFLTPNT